MSEIFRAVSSHPMSRRKRDRYHGTVGSLQGCSPINKSIQIVVSSEPQPMQGHTLARYALLDPLNLCSSICKLKHHLIKLPMNLREIAKERIGHEYCLGNEINALTMYVSG